MSSPAPEPDLVALFARPLQIAGIRYLIAGSVAAMHYSEPRLTIDIDIPIFLQKNDLQLIEEHFSAPAFYCPPTEVLAMESARECRGHFNVIHIASGLKADFYPANRDATFAWAWKHRLVAKYSGEDICVAPPEYVVLWKLIFFAEGRSEKHLRDIARMLQIQPTLPESEFLKDAIHQRHLQDVWMDALRFQ